ncbi:hypothetical protein GX411_10085 [Candidatus Fermentibacteria bacterium]|nr:hypothetical protein [Candidatus Fermentibacteria bacterium]
MTPGLLAALVIAGQAPGGDDSPGGVLLRLWRRFPSCEGTLSGAYAGDEYSFLDRVECSFGGIDLTTLIEKDRGEEWIDLAAAGADWAGTGPVHGASAGWLDCRLGSGLLLDRVGGWGGQGGFVEAKTPSVDSRIRAASSAGACDGEPLTGAGAAVSLGGLETSVILARSWIDPSGDGLHRTPSEIGSRGSVEENLAGIRGTLGPFGAGFTTAERDGRGWSRYGLDLHLPAAGLELSGEAVLGTEGDSASAAFWAAVTESDSTARFCMGVFGCPDEFPLERAGMPIGGVCDVGAGAGVRWKPARGWTVAGSASCLYRDDSGNIRLEASADRRFSPSFEGGLAGRFSEDGAEDSWRLVADFTWEALDALRLTAGLQRTGWADDSSSSGGSSAGVRFVWSASSWLETRAACTAFDTEGWDSRVYCNELGFPGEFASSPQWGRGFLMQVSPVVRPGTGVEARLKLSFLQREGVESMGSDLEETAGDSRTEAGVQIEFPL